MKSWQQTLILGVVLTGCWLEQAIAQTVPTPKNESVPSTHAHNDYEHEYPLFDALHNGFISVEADIWLYPDDNELRVAHDPVVNPGTLPTLNQLYLTPLQNLAQQVNNGGIYADGTPIILLIDIKSEGLSTYSFLNDTLAEYAALSPGLFTTYYKNEFGGYDVTPGAVNVIISGNRPRDYMLSQELRYAAYDGRKSDLGTGVDANFIPLISDNWNNFFSGELAWDGTGTIPNDTKAAIENLVAQVHQEGKILRFWNLPQDTPNVWGPLYDANVDLINTDNLVGLSEYIQARETIPEPLTLLGVGTAIGFGTLFKAKSSQKGNKT